MDHTPEKPRREELAALQAVVDHGTIPLAAAALQVSPHKVDRLLDNLRTRSGFRCLPQLIGWAAGHGWLDLSRFNASPSSISAGSVDGRPPDWTTSRVEHGASRLEKGRSS